MLFATAERARSALDWTPTYVDPNEIAGSAVRWFMECHCESSAALQTNVGKPQEPDSPGVGTSLPCQGERLTAAGGK